MTRRSHVGALLRAAAHLDIIDLNYAYSASRLGALRADDTGAPRRGIAVRIAAFVRGAVRAVASRRTGVVPPPPVDCLAFAASRNQRDALLPVVERLENAVLVGVNGCGDHHLPVFRAYLWSLPFLGLVIWRWLRSSGYTRESFRFAFDLYWLSYGFYIVARQLVRRMHPAVLLLANDHIMWARTLSRAARDEGVKTVYLQHAAVTERFPALGFDVALLDGLDAAEKYARAGPSDTTVLLVGLPKIEGIPAASTTPGALRRLGICASTLDPLDGLRELCRALHEGCDGLAVHLRPHPGDKRVDVLRHVAAESGCGFSDPRREGPAEFLRRVDAVVAGESSILLEAALLDVLPLQFQFSGVADDYYGFARHGLVDGPYQGVDALRARVRVLMREGKPPVRHRARRYCATIGTAYDGRSATLAAEVITDVIRTGTLRLEGWRRVDALKPLAVYELADIEPIRRRPSVPFSHA